MRTNIYHDINSVFRFVCDCVRVLFCDRFVAFWGGSEIVYFCGVGWVVEELEGELAFHVFVYVGELFCDSLV